MVVHLPCPILRYTLIIVTGTHVAFCQPQIVRPIKSFGQMHQVRIIPFHSGSSFHALLDILSYTELASHGDIILDLVNENFSCAI
jgi:hypothetical protein